MSYKTGKTELDIFKTERKEAGPFWVPQEEGWIDGLD